MKNVPIRSIKGNTKNPRQLEKKKFKKLVKSLKEFPEMLEKRPLIVADGVILGGNMRYKAALELGFKEVPIIDASEWTEEQRNQFIIKDNLSFGAWDWDILANEWDAAELEEWGLDVWQPNELDYSVLDEGSLEDDLEGLTDGVKKAVMIEFTLEKYEVAFELIKFWRERGGNVGLMLIEKLKQEREKL